jgi:hypothetical protein
MRSLLVRSVVPAAVVLMLCASGCNETPVKPSGSTPPAPTPGGAGPGAAQYHIFGTVRNDSGAPVVGAKVEVQSLTSSTPGTYFTYLSTRTDQAGRYTLAFSSVPGALVGPESVRANLVAFVWVWPDDSELNGDFQYVNAATSEISKDFTLRRITRVTAGEDVTVTIQPDSPICVSNAQDFHPWPDEWVCSNVHIVAPATGRLVVTATSTSPTGPVPQLLNPESPFTRGISGIEYDVRAGEQAIVCVELPWPAARLPQSFVVTSSVR